MIKLAPSLVEWLFETDRKELAVLLGFGHIELFTEDMQKEYFEWCIAHPEKIRGVKTE